MLEITKRNGKVQKYDRSKLIKHYKQLLKPYCWDDVLNVKKEPDYELMADKVERYLAKNSSSFDIDKANVQAATEMFEIDPIFYDKIAVVLLLEVIYKECLDSLKDLCGDEALQLADGKLRPSTIRASNDLYKLTCGDLFTAIQYEFFKQPHLHIDDLARLSNIDSSRDMKFTYMGLSTLYDRYFLRSKTTGKIVELPQQFWFRIAVGLDATSIEKEFVQEFPGNVKSEWIEVYKNRHDFEFINSLYDKLSNLEYVPSTPTLFHSNTKHSQLSSCYVSTIQDDLKDIFKSYSDNAQLAKFTGGLGVDYTNIRATGSMIQTTGVQSQGVIPFINIFDAAVHSINRSGKKRGAAAVYMEPWHLDFEDFLDLRKTTGDHRRRAHDLHIAVWMNDLFMFRVMNDEVWSMFSPDETPDLHSLYGKEFDIKYLEYEKQGLNNKLKLFKQIKAKDLWRKIVSTCFETGEPYICFKDIINYRSPQKNSGIINSSNLCVEICLNTNKKEIANCNLGSINLKNHINSNGGIDLIKLKETIRIAIKALDNVIDLNFYPVLEAENSNKKYRPIGLGLMGFQDWLFENQIPFDSQEALELSRYLHETIHDYCLEYQQEQNQTYPVYLDSTWNKSLTQPDLYHDYLFDRARRYNLEIDQDILNVLADSIDRYPDPIITKNSNITAIAPNATIANISGVFPCIEPAFSNLYVKENASGMFTVFNKYLVADFMRMGLWNKSICDLLKTTDGNIQNIEGISDEMKLLYRTAFQVDQKKLIKQNAIRGAFIDQSISMNLFYDAIEREKAGASTGKEISDLYFEAWKLGVKTVYYLRTPAATKNQMSTVDESEPMSMNIYDHLLDNRESNSMTKLCKIDDPDCEACQ